MSKIVSVIIPTYNRAEILRRTLQGYVDQSGNHQILEVIVIDDGSADHTRDVVAGYSESRLPIRYCFQENAGLAAARNRAIREANGELLLFGDDDIIPSPGLTEEHVRCHEINCGDNIGVLGYVPWLPQKNPTPFMQWSSHYGPQFNFGYFSAEKQLGFQHGYFCNTSVCKSFIQKHGMFNESFKTYGYEDIELSYRLSRSGYKILYSPAAIGYHNKYETFDDTLRRVEKLYGSWPEFAKTEAGREFLSLWRNGKRKPAEGHGHLLKQMFRPFKKAAAPVLRSLFDTHIPLPHWIYEQVFYQYVTSFETIVKMSES